MKTRTEMQELQQTVAGLKQGLANVQGVLDSANWHDYLTAVLHESLGKYGQVQGSSDSFAEVSTLGLPDRLVREGQRALSRGKGAQVAGCYALLSSCPQWQASSLILHQLG